MRARIVGLTVIGLGALLVVAAFSARSWVPLVSVDLQLDAEFALEAPGEQVTYLDPAALTERTSGETALSVRVRGDADTGDAGDRAAVWEITTATNDADGTLIGTTTTVACLDRRTAEALDCVSESVDGQRVDVQGLTVRFPNDTGRQDYPVWDATVQQSFPARFVGAEDLRGLQVYRFEQEVPAQVIGSVLVPGGLLGSPDAELPADAVHRATRSILVEPVSGVVVSTDENPVTQLRGPDGRPGAVLLSGTFRWSEETVDEAFARAQEVRAEREVLRSAVAWGAGGAGGALLLLGALLVARARTARPDPAEGEPVRTPVPTV